MVVSPAASQPRERTLDALAKGGSGKVGPLAAGVGDESGRVGGRELAQGGVESDREIPGDRVRFRRRGGIDAFGRAGEIVLPAVARPGPMGSDLPRRHTEDPGE